MRRGDSPAKSIPRVKPRPRRELPDEAPKKPPRPSGGRRQPAIPPSYIRGEQATGGRKATPPAPLFPFGPPPTIGPRGAAARRVVQAERQREQQQYLTDLIRQSPKKNLQQYGFQGASMIAAMRGEYNKNLAIARYQAANPERITGVSGREAKIYKAGGVRPVELPEPVAVQAAGFLSGGQDTVAVRAAKDAQVILESLIPALYETGKATAVDVYKAKTGQFSPEESETWTRILRPMIQQYRQQYGSLEAARKYAAEHPLFFLADAALIAGPVARIPGIAKGLTAGAGLRAAVRASVRPEEARLLNVASGAERGVAVQIPWSRHPITRSVQRAYDQTSRRLKTAPLIGENVRGARAAAKLVEKEGRRTKAQAATHARVIRDFSFPDTGTQTSRTALYWLANKPAGMEDKAWLQALLEDHRRMQNEPVKYPDAQEGPALTAARAEERRLTEEYYKAVKERDRRIGELKLKPLKKEVASIQGKMQVARARGEDTAELEVQLKNAQTNLDAARGLDTPPIEGSAAREQLHATITQAVGDEQAGAVMKFADAWARTQSPDNPAAWYESRIPEASFGGEAPALGANVLAQMAGERKGIAGGPSGFDPDDWVIHDTFGDGTVEAIAANGQVWFAPDDPAIEHSILVDASELRLHPRYAEVMDAPIFYSPLRKRIDEKMPDKASPAQIRGLLKDIKQEDVEWSQIDELLLKKAEAEGVKSLTKQQVQRYLDEKGLRIDETLRKTPQDLEPGGAEANYQTKWHSYGSGGGLTIRDGKGYREFVFTLPTEVYGNLYSSGHWNENNVLAHVRFWEIEDDYTGKRHLHIDELQSDWHQEGVRQGYKQKITPEKLARRDELQVEIDKNTQVLHGLLEKYKLGHPHDINSLVNKRIDELRNAASGYMLERYGPDWNRYGTDTMQEYHELYRRIEAEDEELLRYQAIKQEVMGLADTNRLLLNEVDAINHPRGVEDAPFKNNRWVDFALRRMLRYAVDEGFDEVSWSTGKIQATRYELYDDLSRYDEYGEIDYGEFDPTDYGIYESDYEYTYSRAMLDVQPDFPWQHETLLDRYGWQPDWGEGPPWEIEATFHGDTGQGTYGELEIFVPGRKNPIYFHGDLDDLVHYPDPDELPPYSNEDTTWLLQQPWVEHLRDELKDNSSTELHEDIYNERVDDARREFEENYEYPQGDSDEALIEAEEDQLSSSGRGVTKFYDEIVTKAAQKLVKPLGMKVEHGFIEGRYSTEQSGVISDWRQLEVPKIVLEPKAKGEIEKGLPYMQAREGVVKGAVELLGNKQVAYRLFNEADITTAIHELGHAFLYDIDGDDAQTVAKYLGVDSLDQMKREHHEKWARTVERYTIDGKAPTAALAGVFTKLKEWMRRIYQGVQELGVDITPEMRELFDRRFGYMGRTDEDIVKYAGQHQATVEYFGAQSSGAKDKRARLEKMHARKIAKRDIEGLKNRRDELIDARRRTQGEITGDQLDEQIETLNQQIERREIVAAAASERREKQLSTRIADLEKAIEAVDKNPNTRGLEAALDSARYLSRWTEEILLNAFGDERAGQFENRRALLPRRLAERGLIEEEDVAPAETFTGHRSRPYGLRGTITPRGPSSQTIGRTSTTDLRLNKQNELILYQQGRMLTDPAVIIGHWMKAQSIDYLNQVKSWLESVSEPIPLGAEPKEGAYILNPKGKTTPEWWKDDLDMEDPGFVDGLRGYVDSFLGRTGDDAAMRNPETGQYYEGVRQVDPRIVETFFERMGDIRKPAGTALDLVDVANGLVKTSLIYMNPGYIPANFTGNLIFAGLHQHGFLPHSLFKTANVMLKDRELWDGILAEVGTTPTASLLPSEVPGRGRAAGAFLESQKRVSHVVSAAADNWPRAAAWYYEARKAGYKTREQQLGLIRGKEKKAGDRELVSSNATEAMVNFDRLHPWEKRILARVFFVWPWIRGATAWAGHYVKEFPERAAILGQLSRNYDEQGGKEMGDLPPFASQFVPLDEGDGKIRKIINAASISPVGTALELGETSAAVLSSFAEDKPMPRFVSVWDMVNPVLSLAYEFAAGKNQYGTPTGLRTLAVENVVGDRGGLIPWFHFAKQMVDPQDQPPSYYVDTGRWAEINRRFIRFGPQRVNVPALNKLAGGKQAKQSAEEYITEHTEAAEKAWKEAQPGVPFPAEGRRAYAIQAEYDAAAAALKEQLTKQADYQPKPGRREPSLRPLQEASLKAALVRKYFPSVWAQYGVPPIQVYREAGPEGLHNYINGLNRQLFGAKRVLDNMVSTSKRVKTQRKWQQGGGGE